MYFATINTFIDCGASISIKPILGYISGVIGGFSTTNDWTESNNTAQLYTFTQILVKLNIRNGTYMNGQ